MIVFIGNRATKLFQRAANEVESSDKALLSYWDSYSGTPPEYDAAHFNPCLQLLPRSVTNSIDDKGRLGELMQEHAQLFPPTYANIETIPDEKAAPESLWFVKNRHGSGGKDVVCRRLREIEDESLGDYDILQEAVCDLKLIENRKYTIRAYSLIWQGKLFLYDAWYRVIHGGIYSPDATDYAIQVSLRYTGGATAFSPMKTKAGPEEYAAIHQANLQLKNILQPIVSVSTRSDYSILGCDFLIESNGQAKLIEINAYPNLVHMDKRVAEEVNYPMILDTVRLMIKNHPVNAWCEL